MAEVTPEEGGVPAPRRAAQSRELCQEEEFPRHLAVKISEDSVCPSQWGRGRLETQKRSRRARTRTPSFASIHLLSGGGAAAQEAQRRVGKG